MKRLSVFGAGLLFAAGLAVSGMTSPQKVISFLDVGGAWDPSLAFVMIGAIVVHAGGYRWARSRKGPLYADSFRVPMRTEINLKLVFGSALFGLGWGLGGYCPGPAVSSLVTLRADVVVFVAAMLTGMVAYRRFAGKL